MGMFTACSDGDKANVTVPEAYYVGKQVGNFDASEWYPGGELGTTDNISSSAFSDQTPAIDNDKGFVQSVLPG